MATVNGITAEKAMEILNSTIESAVISGTSLILNKVDGSTENAGNFQTYIDGQINPALDAALVPMQAQVDDAIADIPTEVASSVNSAVPAAVAGRLTAKGNVTGAITFTALTAADMVNRIFTMTLTGNATLNISSLPSGITPGTQFALVIHQDSTGGRTLTTTGFLRSQGVLVLSTAANAIDILTCLTDGTNWYIGAMGVGFA